MNIALLTRNRPPPPAVNTRRMAIGQTQMRFIPPVEGKPYQFEGYAVTWASVNAYGEQFLKGAFADLIAAGKKIHMYYNHGYMDWLGSDKYRIGKWLELREDDTGLFVRGELTAGLDLADRVGAMLQHGTIDGFSIAFFDTNPVDTVYADNNVLQIKRADLYEISVVDEPADRTARATAVDSAVSAVNNARDAAELLQSVGFSSDGASALLARLDAISTKPADHATTVATAATTPVFEGLNGLLARLST